jgi:hypothetical protein
MLASPLANWDLSPLHKSLNQFNTLIGKGYCNIQRPCVQLLSNASSTTIGSPGVTLTVMSPICRRCRMPFFIFKITSENELEYLSEEEKYRPAREKVRQLRAAHEAADGATYRMVFANSVGQGEKLLATTEQDGKIIGDD